ncbi:protein kinase [Streptomyces sp. NPDC086549]|uniref:protein kinase domain-containing protein n=1 Tax=Streptomyces sp. NPDC086549 TaxID=3365752 RepID=UPI00381B0842
MALFEALEPEDPRRVGRYRIVARLGAGGMGQVFLARSPGGSPRAVKVVRPDLARDFDFRRRFAREVTAARRVNGAFTAGVVDADPDGSPPWLATVYIPGLSLGEAVAGHGPWPPQPVLALGAALAEALEAIHTAGVVHRDLKPSNVLLAADGPRVIDFGISVASEASALTHTGMTIGTPGFMSPEQLTGHTVGPASDIFALGAVLAYTTTGVGPFGTGSAHALHFRTVYEQPNLDSLPPELRHLVAACLAKQPDQRPTVADLFDRLSTAYDTDGQTSAATLLLAEPGWMPDQIAQLVREHTSTDLPRTPSPTPPETLSAPRPATQPDAANPRPSEAPLPPSAEPPPPPASPTAPAAPEAHQAATQTGEQPAPGTSESGPSEHHADPIPPPHGHTPERRPLISRRRALLALTGTTLAAATTLTTWRFLDNGSSGSHSSGKSSSSATPSPTRTPGIQLWAFPTKGELDSSPTVADGVVYVGSNDHNLYAVQT